MVCHSMDNNTRTGSCHISLLKCKYFNQSDLPNGLRFYRSTHPWYYRLCIKFGVSNLCFFRSYGGNEPWGDGLEPPPPPP